MSASAPAATPRVPPVDLLAIAALALIVVGGVFMAANFPGPPPLALPVVLLALSALLIVVSAALLARLHAFAWRCFFRVASWALLAYVISAAMIEYAFVHNRAAGGPLLVVTLMLVVYSVDVPLVIAFTVARHQHPV